jgi:diamine N-acetyltransferase
MDVELVEITRQNVRAVCDLTVGPGQIGFVAPNALSLAEASVQPGIAWPRAVAVNGELVGFVMLSVNPDDPDGWWFFLWRFMIAAEHQGKGYGKAALLLGLDECRRRGATELFTSWVVAEGGPEGFYLGLGFEPTGEWDDDEKVARLAL